MVGMQKKKKGTYPKIKRRKNDSGEEENLPEKSDMILKEKRAKSIRFHSFPFYFLHQLLFQHLFRRQHQKHKIGGSAAQNVFGLLPEVGPFFQLRKVGANDSGS